MYQIHGLNHNTNILNCATNDDDDGESMSESSQTLFVPGHVGGRRANNFNYVHRKAHFQNNL